MLPKPRYGTFLSTLLGLGVQPTENDILQLIPSRCERSRGENGESGERLSLGRTELPSLQAHAGWTERHLSKCALPMPSQIAARGTVLRLYPCLRACPPIEFFIVARPTERF